MQYRAKDAYQDKQVVNNYDNLRFKSFKGKITNWLELKLIDRALKYTKITPPARILDVPCGTGRLSMHLLKRKYLVTGVDISAEMVRYSEGRIKKEGVDYEFSLKVGDAEELLFLDNSFDVVISLRLLGHVPPENRLRILKELNRVCSKFMIVAYYSRDSISGILRKNKRVRSNIKWYPVTISEMDLEFRKLGLKKEKVYHLVRGLSETMIVILKK